MSDFEQKIFDAVSQAFQEVYGLEPAPDVLTVEVPRDTKLGDYATGAAMKLAKTLHKSPMDIAAPIVDKLRELLPEAESITVAKPGFINFKLKSGALAALINQILTAGDNYGQNTSGDGVHILVEWVSANPTGDLHCGHARGAAWAGTPPDAPPSPPRAWGPTCARRSLKKSRPSPFRTSTGFPPPPSSPGSPTI